MKKNKISKASKKRLIVFGTASIFIIGYFIFNLGFNIYNLYSLKKSENKFISDLTELKRQEKILNQEIDKLQDPEYIAKYARENYSYSKNGEYIIKLKDEKNKESEDEKFNLNIDYNYIIYGGIGLLIIIFIYALKKKN